MLIRFTIDNWMSFKNEVAFSMIASRERQHGDRVYKLDKYGSRILPVAAIYGGNASGKTNFFKAIHFAKTMIVRGSQPDSLIPVEAFRLDANSFERPTKFAFEILIEDNIYEYSFVITSKEVIEEKLVLIKTTSETILFERKNGKPHFDSALDKDQFLHFAFQGTRENQLFLTNSVSQKVDNFKPIYDWFKDTLELVAPDSRFEPFEQFLDELNPLYITMNEMLSELDTGISHLGGEEIPFENMPIDELLRQRLKEDIKEGMTVRITSEPINERFIITRKNEQLIAKKLVAYHSKDDGSEAKFEIRHESDGSQRVIDLLPAFLELSPKNSNRVYVIDEIDRSLHTLMTQKLVSAYLNRCSNETRSQLLITTHDVLLMDQDLLRRDEMWVAERGSNGVSTLLSFSEFKEVRYDKDIRKSYLQGRLGGIPRILLSGISRELPEEINGELF